MTLARKYHLAIKWKSWHAQPVMQKKLQSTKGLGIAPGVQLHVAITGSAVGDSEFIPIRTLNEAAAAFRAFCEENGFGARDAGHCRIYHGSKPVASVSFNGNVWQGVYPHGKDDLLLNVTGLEWNGQRWDLPKETACAS